MFEGSFTLCSALGSSQNLTNEILLQESANVAWLPLPSCAHPQRRAQRSFFRPESPASGAAGSGWRGVSSRSRCFAPLSPSFTSSRGRAGGAGRESVVPASLFAPGSCIYLPPARACLAYSYRRLFPLTTDAPPGFHWLLRTLPRPAGPTSSEQLACGSRGLRD